MKIAMIGQKRIPSREGGVEIVVEELSKRMVRLGHEVVCFNRRGHHVSGKAYSTQAVKEYEGINVKSVFTVERKGFAAFTASFFASLQAAFGKFDVVHYHAEGPCIMCFIPKLFGKRIIATIHGLDWQRAKWSKFATTVIKLGEKMAVKHADEIIVLSENIQNYFEKEYNRKTTFIPNGVEHHEPIEADVIASKWGLEKDSYILFLGRIVPEKGLNYLIDAYMSLNSDKKLVIAGGPSDSREYYEQICERVKDCDNIILTGFISGQDLHELYSNAYVYVLPSDLEGMPISLLEAMNYGNCCLVSDIPECKEVVEDKAVVFKRGDAENLQKQLQLLCDNKEMVDFYKSTASDFICKKYNWDDIVEKTLSLYKKRFDCRCKN